MKCGRSNCAQFQKLELVARRSATARATRPPLPPRRHPPGPAMRWLTNASWFAFGMQAFTRAGYERAAAAFDDA